MVYAVVSAFLSFSFTEEDAIDVFCSVYGLDRIDQYLIFRSCDYFSSFRGQIRLDLGLWNGFFISCKEIISWFAGGEISV